MAARIRLKRIGAKNAPVYRIVVADNRGPRDGGCIEELGTYHPLQTNENFTLDLERAEYWLGVGARPSDTVASFIKKARKAKLVEPEADSETQAEAEKETATETVTETVAETETTTETVTETEAAPPSEEA
ncbi:MAG TPA: 30S ribosomal protein S16 [Verrucomicrobiales bacterium]|nr:30S ribosomal protein S16 [Verrucomicrobiales bacterium]HIL72405.1 30S ribosomal protein S16 [Verrucomicrobiota bacterium]